VKDKNLYSESTWKCNNLILKDPELKQKITALAASQNTRGKGWWDDFKIQCTAIIKTFCREKRAEQYKEINLIKNNIEFELRHDQDLAKIYQLKKDLKFLMEKMGECARARAKALDLQLGEKINGYFLKKERERGEANRIKEIENVGTDSALIKNYFYSKYQHKFAKKPRDEGADADLFSNLSQIGDFENFNLCKNIQDQEILHYTNILVIVISFENMHFQNV